MGVLGISGSAAKNSNGLNFGRYDVKRKNNWIMTFSKGLWVDDVARSSLTVALFKAARPTFSFGEAKLNFANESWFVATRPEPQELAVSMYDALPSTGSNVDFKSSIGQPHPDKNAGQISAAQLMYNWCLLIYNPTSGSIGLASEYKTEAFVTLYAGKSDTPIERWMYLGIFPKSVNMGDLDWSAEGDPLTIECTFKYDKPFRISPSGPGSQPNTAADLLLPERAFFNIT
jgi:hypothetical protein